MHECTRARTHDFTGRWRKVDLVTLCELIRISGPERSNVVRQAVREYLDVSRPKVHSLLSDETDPSLSRLRFQ